MSFPNARINTFFQKNQVWRTDQLSSCYIVAETLLGLNRLPILLKGTRYFYVLGTLAIAYSLAAFSWSIYTTYDVCKLNVFDSWVTFITRCFEHTFCVLISFLTWKRLARYYNELNKFDFEIGCRPKMTRESFINFLFIVIFMALASVFYGWTSAFVFVLPSYAFLSYLMIYLTLCLEISYYGHLLSLLVSRLRLINYYMELTLASGDQAKRPDIYEFWTFKNKNYENTEIIKIMDIYEIVIDAYSYLMEALKWQLLSILISSFVCTLTFCYDISQHIMHDGVENPLKYVATDVGLMVLEVVPLFSPCIFGDRVHSEVKRLRELVAARLYENKLDKAGRSTARALLALTEARDLSFSLLQMLSVDVTLPFKFIGLVLTYLIILVQFDKVIHAAKYSKSPL